MGCGIFRCILLSGACTICANSKNFVYNATNGAEGLCNNSFSACERVEFTGIDKIQKCVSTKPIARYIYSKKICKNSITSQLTGGEVAGDGMRYGLHKRHAVQPITRRLDPLLQK